MTTVLVLQNWPKTVTKTSTVGRTRTLRFSTDKSLHLCVNALLHCCVIKTLIDQPDSHLFLLLCTFHLSCPRLYNFDPFLPFNLLLQQHKYSLQTMFRPARRTLSHPRSSGDGRPLWASPIFMLLIGLFSGAALTYLLILPMQTTTVVMTSPTHAPPALRSASKQESQGWHPIHVFYGKEEGLKLDPNKEWFAQVHQDEIVVNLLGENGYFIDLAANDAKELSNTVGLEKHGWNGTYPKVDLFSKILRS